MKEFKVSTSEERLLNGIGEILEVVAKDKPVSSAEPITPREKKLLANIKEILTLIATNNPEISQEKAEQLAIREAVVNEKITMLLKQLSKVPPGKFAKGLKNEINNIEKNIISGKNKPAN